jgi:large subunit ribosomal protein L31
MKTDIHPENMDCDITCACGVTYKTVSTKSKMRVDICAACHPFYTGQQSTIIDTAGRVESFRRRYGLTAEDQEEQA